MLVSVLCRCITASMSCVGSYFSGTNLLCVVGILFSWAIFLHCNLFTIVMLLSSCHYIILVMLCSSLASAIDDAL